MQRYFLFFYFPSFLLSVFKGMLRLLRGKDAY